MLCTEFVIQIKQLVSVCWLAEERRGRFLFSAQKVKMTKLSQVVMIVGEAERWQGNVRNADEETKNFKDFSLVKKD